MDGKRFSSPNDCKKNLQNSMPNIEWITAKIRGAIKKSEICVNNALFNILSSVPIFLNIIYLSLLSALSLNSFNARIAALDIKNITPI